MIGGEHLPGGHSLEALGILLADFCMENCFSPRQESFYGHFMGEDTTGVSESSEAKCHFFGPYGFLAFFKGDLVTIILIYEIDFFDNIFVDFYSIFYDDLNIGFYELSRVDPTGQLFKEFAF